MLLEILITLAFGLSAFLIFVYYVKKGQFDSSEEVKYQMFHDEHEELKQHVAKRARNEKPLDGSQS